MHNIWWFLASVSTNVSYWCTFVNSQKGANGPILNCVRFGLFIKTQDHSCIIGERTDLYNWVNDLKPKSLQYRYIHFHLFINLLFLLTLYLSLGYC